MAVGRFQVMATLQAARAYVLGLPLASAKSWGLNRAIFYAAAKKGFFKGRAITPERIKVPDEIVEKELRREVGKTFKIRHLGDEMGYSVQIKGKVLYLIGDEIQNPEDFDRQIESRFEGKFPQAWKEAVAICKKYDAGVLRSQRYFYETVYKARRDELAAKWSKLLK